MGEAKRRASSDPYFGKVPKSGKGLIISNPLVIDGTSVFIRNSNLDPLELRRALLFWDRIVWPTSNGIFICGGIDSEYLEERGVLKRPRYQVNGDAAAALADAFLQAFNEKEIAEPGQWALSTGEDALILRSSEVINDRGASVDLYRAVPIPNHDVPLEDILNFREKRLPEVRAFVVAIDEFYEKWACAEDQAHQLNLAKRQIEIACLDLIKVTRESKNPFRLSSWKIGFALNPISIVGAASLGKILDPVLGLPGLGAVLTGAASTISIKRDIGFKRDVAASKPFRFSATLELDAI